MTEKDQADLDAEEILSPANRWPPSRIELHGIIAAKLGEKDAEIEKLRAELKAEGERVMYRDIDILRTAPYVGQVWLIDRERAKDAIRAAQAQEREG